MKDNVSRSLRELRIARMIHDGKRTFTLIDAVEACYPEGEPRPRWVGRSVAWTLRNMIAKSTTTRAIYRTSARGRGHKGVYMAKGRW